jgi:arylsulfatase A
MEYRKNLLAVVALVIGLVAMPELGAAEKQWNVVLILADDLGWKDLSCFGSDLHETPNLNELAKKGMRFTQAYSACTVCSPTRAALLTGKYPARLHITDWIPGAMPDNPKLLVPDWTKYLPASEKTIARYFKEAGYKTASIGKWHLGGEEYYPQKHGFDVNIAGTEKAQPPSYFAPWKIPTLAEGKDGDYLTDRLADEAVKFIQDSSKGPFFLYLPHFAVHTPIQARKDLLAKYNAKLREGANHVNPAYAAMVESLDQSVGRVLNALKAAGVEDQTLVIFTSDNGGRIPTTNNKPLRYGKASAYEGGVRVPLIVSYPGITKPGSVCDDAVITMDLFRTMHDMILATPDILRNCDGENLEPLLKGQGKLKRNELYWHYPHHQHYQKGGTMPYGAIRSGDWKLIEFFNDGTLELYNIGEDIAEEKNLASQFPEIKKQLHERLVAWRLGVNAQLPQPNPKYDPKKPEYTPLMNNPKQKKKV